MSDPDTREREAIVRAFTELLREPLAAWQRDFGPPEDHATPGALLRVPSRLLRAHGVPAPCSVCVLRLDGDEALVVPLRVEERAAVGEVLIPPRLSPFGTGGTGAMVLEVDCVLRLPLVALQGFRAFARCPAVAEIPPMRMLAPPPAKWPAYAAWQRLIAALPRGD